MTAAFWDFLGWEQLTAAEQACALAGAGLGLVAWHGRHYRAGRLLHPQQQRGRR